MDCPAQSPGCSKQKAGAQTTLLLRMDFFFFFFNLERPLFLTEYNSQTKTVNGLLNWGDSKKFLDL